MGMFDTVYCEYPLPDARHQDLDFQTKNLECLLHTYTNHPRRPVGAAGGEWVGSKPGP